MLSLVNSPTTLRPVATPQLLSDICYGVPSCAPLVQHELLKSVREQMPQAYARATSELGLTVAKTQELIERPISIISAARAIRLARLIAYEPNVREVFSDAGHNLFDVMNQKFPGVIKAGVRTLPRSMRARLAVAWTKHVAYGFAGSVNRITAQPTRGGVVLSISNGVFADRLDTLGGAHAYYRNIIETMFQQFARVDCEVNEVRRPRVHLNQCHYEIVWEA
ncbi:MAG: hypothetical protein M3X11_11460 [Acidobacteriota bacterium]|nr:hypothetical protein [Acidobacteriota bacterium]